MFGRGVNLPAELLYLLPCEGKTKYVTEYAAELRDNMENCYIIVRKNLKEAAERQKRDYDTRVVERKYKLGDLVYKRNRPGKKLDEKYTGPFFISKCLSPSVYEIRGKKKIFVVHHDRIKPYHSEDLPRWAANVKKNLAKV